MAPFSVFQPRFDWAEKYGLKVLLELHGLVGSQNGEHHSGECGPLSWLQPANRKSLGLLDTEEKGCIGK